MCPILEIRIVFIGVQFVDSFNLDDITCLQECKYYLATNVNVYFSLCFVQYERDSNLAE